MAFPTAITNEPPPCMSSEDEDSEEFHSHGLKLDVPSGEPTPVSTPLKKAKPPSNSNSKDDDGAPTFVNNNSKTIENRDKDLVLEVVSNNAAEESLSVPEATSGSHLLLEDSADLPKVNGTSSPEPVNNDFYENEKVVTLTNHLQSTGAAASNSISNNESNDGVWRLEEDSAEDIDGLVVATTASASAEPETANEICDKSANNNVSDLLNQSSSGQCEQLSDPSSPSGESEESSNEVQQQIEQDKLSENDEESFRDALPPASSPPHIQNLEVSEGPSEIGEDLNSSRVTADNSEFQAASSTSGDVQESSSPSNTEAVTTTAGVVDQTGFEDDDDEFGDFGAFQSIPNTSAAASSSAASNTEQGMDSTGPSSSSVPQTMGFDDEDDGFGDFAQVPAAAAATSFQIPQASAAAQTRDDSADFADFQDCSFPSFGVPSLTKRHSSTSSDSSISMISSKADSIIKSLFVADSSSSSALPNAADADEVKLKNIDSEISISNDEVWARVQDFEGSHGLAFKLGNSLTEKRLLRSLHIDNSNIMYHEKWGTIEVPKFAASLVMSSPLQPQSCNLPNVGDSQSKADNPNVTVNNNNLKEGISCQEQDKPASISAEAQEILRQLPDLSYMRANTLVFPQTSPSGI